MLFIDWPFWQRVVAATSIVAACVWIARKSLHWRTSYRVLTFVAGATLASPAALVLLFAVLATLNGCDSNGKPVYSPDRHAAARIQNWDAGATGGGTDIRVFQRGGFDTRRVFAGGWKSISQDDLHWLDDHHLEITFHHWDGYDEAGSCSDAGAIHVTCVPR